MSFSFPFCFARLAMKTNCKQFVALWIQNKCRTLSNNMHMRWTKKCNQFAGIKPYCPGFWKINSHKTFTRNNLWLHYGLHLITKKVIGLCAAFFDVLLTRFAFFSSQFNSNQFNVRDVIRGSDGTYIATTKKKTTTTPSIRKTRWKLLWNFFGIMLCVVQKHGFCCKHTPAHTQSIFQIFF